jgi:aspartate aminotransferase
MADNTAHRIEELQESSTLKMAKISRELKAQGQDIVNLNLGEPDFDTPEHIRQAAIEAINQGYTHYPPVAGYPELRQAVSDKFRNENNLHYTTSQVIVSTGAKQSIINVLMSILNKGDEIIIPSPFWVSYPEMVKLSEATSVFIKTTAASNYKITPEQLEAAITPRTRAFIYSSPCNPSGAVYSREELKGLVEVFAKHPQIHIISDEIYEHINYVGKHVSIAEFPEVHDRVAVINGVSKAFAMTGWRIGYMGGPEWLVKACEKLQGQFTSGACSISQRAALAALTEDMRPTERMCEAFTRRRSFIAEKMREIEGVTFNMPEGAFYLFPDMSYYYGKSYGGFTVKDGDDLSMYLLQEARVSVVSGDGFGSPECIRMSFAASHGAIEDGVQQIKEALAKLK